MIRDDPRTDLRETIWELKDILRDINRALEDSNILTDTESLFILRGRDDINQTIDFLENRLNAE